jgi:hypothetical protein
MAHWPGVGYISDLIKIHDGPWRLMKLGGGVEARLHIHSNLNYIQNKGDCIQEKIRIYERKTHYIVKYPVERKL